MVKDYLKVITAEQLQAQVTPKQATPFFVDKLTQLSLHLDRKLRELQSLLINSLLHGIRRILEWHFLVGTVPVIWGKLKFRKF